MGLPCPAKHFPSLTTLTDNTCGMASKGTRCSARQLTGMQPGLAEQCVSHRGCSLHGAVPACCLAQTSGPGLSRRRDKGQSGCCCQEGRQGTVYAVGEKGRWQGGRVVAGDMGKRPTKLLHQVTADPWAVLTSKQQLVRACCSLSPSQQHLSYNSCWISEAIHCPACFSNRQYFPIVN